MQGYILNVSKYKDEDLIVTVLTPQNLLTLYRFYGARHSTINLGYKIDFEIESIVNVAISRLRNIIHLGTLWNRERAKMLAWNQFITLLNTHLRGIEAIDSFYFDLLDSTARAMEKQNPKRACIDAYLLLLEFEGRLHTEAVCFVCEEMVEEPLSLGRAFLPAHTGCIYGRRLDKEAIVVMLETKKSTLLDDTTIENLWNILLEGM
jgi:recombinational DNA repair protein (RecF pathway)